MKKIELYHASNQIISKVDIHHGRKNADFAQGFYLSDDKEFVSRWSKLRKDEDSYINIYELDLEDLKTIELKRDKQWFDYIFSNRHNHQDYLSEYDLIIGPIANDTIYNTFGVITSGILDDQVAFKLLDIGPIYKQFVIKTDKANSHLKYIDSYIIDKEKIIEYQYIKKIEEEKYLVSFNEILEKYADD